MSRKHYPSDISREQFEPIRGLLEGARQKRRAVPADFPAPSTVRYYFDQWSRVRQGESESLLARALKKSGGTRTQEQRTAALDDLLHRGRAKREEHGHGAAQGI